MSYPMTKDGFDRLEIELKDLMTQRPKISKEIGVAREHGDIKENAEYHAARERQSWIECRITELEDTIAKAQIIDLATIKSRQIMFGAKITLVNEETDEEVKYMMVGSVEADLGKGLISNTSPIGQALLGKKKGESIEVYAPAGTKYYEILKVSYAK